MEWKKIANVGDGPSRRKPSGRRNPPPDRKRGRHRGSLLHGDARPLPGGSAAKDFGGRRASPRLVLAVGVGTRFRGGSLVSSRHQGREAALALGSRGLARGRTPLPRRGGKKLPRRLPRGGRASSHPI